MIKKYNKNILVAFLVGLLFSTSLSIANAALATSPWLSYSCFGKDYACYSSVSTDFDHAWAITQANSNSGYVPAGYIGICPRLYNGNDQLCQTVDWQYNSTSVQAKQVSTGFYTVSGTYYSFGMTRAYNGNGYNTYYTYKSPSLNY